MVERHDSEFECGVCCGCGFRMNVREMHTNAFERQTTEAVEIENMNTPSMNRKSSYDVSRPLGRLNIICSL